MAITDNLIAYYKADESSGNANDSVGTRHLTNTNAAFDTGKIGNALSCSSPNTNKKFQYTGSYGLTSSSSWTIAYWYLNDGTSLNAVMELCYASGTKNVVIQRDAGNNQISLYTQSGAFNSATQGAGSETSGQWYMVVVTCTSGGNVVWYKNNSLLGSVTNTGTISKTELLALGSSPSIGWFGSGRHDMIGVWSSVLSSGDMDTLWNGGNGYQLFSEVANTGAFFQMF